MFPSKRYLLVLIGDATCLVFSFVWVTTLRRWANIDWPLIQSHTILFSALIPFWLWIFHLSGFYDLKYRYHPPRSLILSGILASIILSALILYCLAGVWDIPTPKVILLLAGFLAWVTLEFWRERVAGGEKTDGGFSLVVDRSVLQKGTLNGCNEIIKSAALEGKAIMTRSALETLHSGKVPLEEMDPLWVVERVLLPQTSKALYGLFKRILDIAIAVLVLPLALGLGVFVASWIFIWLGRPVFYKQRRVGKGKQVFTLWKFRTMREEPNRDALTQVADARVPRALRWIRRLHLDEVPQLINILKGEMSWVGPRPEQAAINDDFESKIEYFWLRHLVSPGLTGWAQVNTGYAGDLTSARERLSYDLYYVVHRSFPLDTAVMLRTLRNLLTADGR